MKKFSIILMLLTSSTCFCYAQSNIGPRLLAMGRNTGAINDEWSIEGNVAAINQFTKTSVAINYLKYSFDKELSNQGFTAILPIKNTILGFSAQRYGISVYNQIATGISVTKCFGEKLSIGLKGNYHQIKISNYGTTKSYSINFGIYYQLNKQIGLGFYSNNLAQQHQNVNNSPEISSSTHIGASYRASKKVLIATTISWFTNQNIDVSLGLEYLIIDKIALRTGITTNPFKQYAGLGFSHKNIKIDLALENDKNLGYIPQIALGYAF